MTSSPRSFRHWTLRYLIDRTRDRWYQATHPTDPWLTPISINFLDGWLKPTDRGLEFGSGRSTLWFARRVTTLTSVEHAPVWYERTHRELAAQGINNVDYRLVTGQSGEDPAGYSSVADNFAEETLDFVLVDGIYRDTCAMATLRKLRPGGLLVIDDAHRYLPSHSIAPYARSQALGPATPLWATFLTKVQTWRCLWTSKGVSDTVLYIKP